MFQCSFYYFKLFIVYFEDIGKKRVKNEIYKNVVFYKVILELKVEWVESISNDSLWVSRVEKFGLTLNAKKEFINFYWFWIVF